LGNRLSVMNESQAIEVLAQVKAKVGRMFKSQIRECWMTGNYRHHCLEQWSSQLQQIRNQFGPTWLTRVKLPPIKIVLPNLASQLGFTPENWGKD